MILTHSGLRGIFGKTLKIEDVKKYSIGFSHIIDRTSSVLIGRDTRESSPILYKTITNTLLSCGINLTDVGIVPTPIILHTLSRNTYDGAIIITGSHNPPEYNGIKFVNSSGLFFGTAEITKLNGIVNDIDNYQYFSSKKGHLTSRYVIPEYIECALPHLHFPEVITRPLKILIDDNAGTANPALKMLLMQFNISVEAINEEFDKGNVFPRQIEPIPQNLSDISKRMKLGKHTIGFAFDCDADRIAIVDEKGTVHTEDVAISLLVYSILSSRFTAQILTKTFIVTNIASSHIFDDIAEKFQATLIRTPIGERFLTEKMIELKNEYPNAFIIGGEGSSGGFMYPEFNLARDGLFAAAKICEILSSRKKSVSEICDELPKYYSFREKIQIKNRVDMKYLQLKLIDSGFKFTKIGNDLFLENENPYERILIHPSNTEPVIRIIVESISSIRSKEIAQIILSSLSI